jgi:murein DD-endopeptidase MepM/ murein hydrolase activator NlpD
MYWNIRNKLLLFYLFILIIEILIVGNTLNSIGLHSIIKSANNHGINYDAFREMRLTKDMIHTVKTDILPLENNNKRSGLKKKEIYNAIDSLALSMMINQYNLIKPRKISKKNLRSLFLGLSCNSSFLELRKYYSAILQDIECYPVMTDSEDKTKTTFIDSWNMQRSYGGIRRHEGTDIMPENNIRGYYHVISMTDGMIEKMGWLEKGGYRIGIRGNHGAYFYYAHLDSYAPGLSVGSSVKAGQFLGYMGDSGYGAEGTVGKFEVHLHVGIYVNSSFGEMSVNPYSILKYLENNEAE